MGLSGSLVMNNRLKEMIVKDKSSNPDKLIGLLRSEIFFVLKNYMDISVKNIDLSIGVDNDGKYVLSVSAFADKLYVINCIS